MLFFQVPYISVKILYSKYFEIIGITILNNSVAPYMKSRHINIIFVRNQDMPEDNHYSEATIQVSMEISNILRLNLTVYG
jgi:hypothetical protein